MCKLCNFGHLTPFDVFLYVYLINSDIFIVSSAVCDPAYRRPRNLRDLIVRAKVPPLTDETSSPIQYGNFRHGINRCVVCKDHMKERDTFISHSNNNSHQIRGNISCYTSNVIYLISCRVCGIQYAGKTRTTLKGQFYGYRSILLLVITLISPTILSLT